MPDWSRQPLALTPRVVLQREAVFGALIDEIYGVLATAHILARCQSSNLLVVHSKG